MVQIGGISGDIYLFYIDVRHWISSYFAENESASSPAKLLTQPYHRLNCPRSRRKTRPGLRADGYAEKRRAQKSQPPHSYLNRRLRLRRIRQGLAHYDRGYAKKAV